MADENRMLKAALKYAAIGWYVFPLRSKEVRNKDGEVIYDIKMPHPMLGAKDGHKLASIDPKQIKEWWNADPKAGIGVYLAKSGLIAFDTDPKDDGPTKLRKIEAEYGELLTPVVQISGSGGEHRVFAAPAGLSPPGKLLGNKGVDIKYNGYIVLSPSPHPNGRRYSWRAGCDPFSNLDFIPNVPSWTLQYRPGQEVSTVTSKAGDDVFAEDTPKVGRSLDQINDMLEMVPNSGAEELDYDDWLNVLAGVYHETDGSAEACEIVRAWSAQSSKHTDQKFDKSWRSLNIANKGRQPVTLRFVMKLAKERLDQAKAAQVEDLRERLETAPSVAAVKAICAEVKRTDIDRVDRSAFAMKVQAKLKELTKATIPISEVRNLIRYESTENTEKPTWLQGWVYCSLDNEFVHAQTGRALSPTAFNLAFNFLLLSPSDRLEGRSEPADQAVAMALNVYQIPRVHQRQYMPGEEEFFDFNGLPCLNTFTRRLQPSLPDKLTVADRANIAIVEAHFAHMIPDPRERALVLSWLAYIVQTERRPNWSVVLQGPEGDGKTFFTELMGCVLGAGNVKVVDPIQIKSDFSDWAVGSLLTVVEEMKLHGQHRYDVLDKMKPFITNSTITVHPKGSKGFQAPNTAGYIMFTNFRDALPVGSGDSRYFIVASPRQQLVQVEAFKRDNPDYYPALYNTILESPGALRQWLLSVPLADEFNPSARAPKSREKAMLAELNKTDAERATEALLESGAHLDISDVILCSDTLIDKLTEHGDPAPYGHALKHMLLHNLGFTPLGRFKVEGKMRRYWTREPSTFAGLDEAGVAQTVRSLLDTHGL